jgi:hypothetical protein
MRLRGHARPRAPVASAVMEFLVLFCIMFVLVVIFGAITKPRT